MVVGGCVIPRSAGFRIKDNAFTHRVLPVISPEEKTVALDSVLIVREHAHDETPLHRICGKDLALECPRIVIVN